MFERLPEDQIRAIGFDIVDKTLKLVSGTENLKGIYSIFLNLNDCLIFDESKIGRKIHDLTKHEDFKWAEWDYWYPKFSSCQCFTSRFLKFSKNPYKPTRLQMCKILATTVHTRVSYVVYRTEFGFLDRSWCAYQNNEADIFWQKKALNDPKCPWKYKDILPSIPGADIR